LGNQRLQFEITDSTLEKKSETRRSAEIL